MDIFWTFYLNHLSPLWGYFSISKVFHQMDLVAPRIEIPHDPDAHEIPVPCP